MKKISREHYLNEPFGVAKDVILGAYLFSNIGGELTGGIITEVEVYQGAVDKAAHSYLCKKTERTKIQFGAGGYAYIFLIYGIHYQFCVVTNIENIPDVVLIRSLQPTVGVDIMKSRRGNAPENKLTVGPGNVCKALNITKAHYGEDLCGDTIYLCWNDQLKEKQITETTRVGIDYAEEYALVPWRYYLSDNIFVSKTISSQKYREP